VVAFEMMQLIAATGGPMGERRGLDAGAAEKALDPRLDGNVEIDPAGVDEQRNLPGGDGAEENRAAAAPAAVNEGTRRVPQAVPLSSQRATWVSRRRLSVSARPRG